ncbi:MAG: hypothetical protein MO853_12770 [Candidatus Protistobacter heckmanni]|nr:hypothetical protein [Candidatus Protistobacter heckmanni]
MPDCVFIDLQYGDTAAERAALRAETGMAPLHFDDVDNLHDFESVFALI